MIRAGFVFIMFWLQMICMIPNRMRARWHEKRGDLDRARTIGRKQAVNWSRNLMWYSGIRAKVIGTLKVPEGAAVLIVSNHQAAYDIPLIAGYVGVPPAFIAKVELSKIPLVGEWIRLAGGIFLDRSDRRKSIEAVKLAVETLQKGISMVVFPEGTRSGRATMAPFKKGSTSIAVKAGVPIVPVTVRHTWKIQHEKKGHLQAMEVELYIHDPIDTTTLSAEERDQLSQHIQEIISKPLIGDAEVLIEDTEKVENHT